MATNTTPGNVSAPSIAEHVKTRRNALSGSVDLNTRPWGLALSGGGIRSATFSFGLLKALAQQKLFHRFDILSTVSGGGYIGSTIGRLFQNPGSTAGAAEEAIAEAGTRPFGVWLRSNGRYLIPQGTKDLVFAVANFGRNLLGVHVELALLSLVMGALLVGLDLRVWDWGDCVFRAGACWRPTWIDASTLALLAGPPPIWLVLPLLFWAGAALACAYWALPAEKGGRWFIQPLLTGLLALVGITLLVRHTTGALDLLPRVTGTLKLPGVLAVTVGAFLLAWLVGVLVAAVMTMIGLKPDSSRNRLTAWLSLVLSFSLVVFGLGIADYLAFSLGNLDSSKQGTFGAALALFAIALRAALPKIADLPKSLTPGTRRGVMGTLNVTGLLLLALIVIFWMSWVHRATSDVLFGLRPAELLFPPAYEVLWWLALPPLLLILVSMRNRDFLNRSSLFTFYRARLIRSFLGAGNSSRFGGRSPIAKARVSAPTAQVAEVQETDDVPMKDYQPHARGGPVHLLNVCVNQTRGPKGGMFNQDRKGLLLTVGPNGQTCRCPNEWSYPSDKARMTLGSWMAISGAAVAPGLGGSTRSGIAAVLMLAGLRLGYWWDSLNFGRAGEKQAPAVGKYGQFFSELRGRFDGDKSRDWFLSDGGHFENTGAYGLLREECEVIVVADCGADPRYAFGDLENLVRKARIDLQADITFLRPKSAKEIAEASPSPAPADPLADSVGIFGSLNDLASSDSEACLALARIDYRHSGLIGHMVIVKPNLCHGVPVDLVNFKADNPLFPQEPTTDQFFSEVQWESYFQLGQTLGKSIKEEHLGDLAKFAKKYFSDDDGAILVVDATGQKSVQFSVKRLSSRIVSTGAVSATLSLGAVTTIGLTAWDAVSKGLSSMRLQEQIEPGTYKELTDIFGKLSPPGPAASAPDARLGEMATALLRIGDAVCTARNLSAFKQSELMELMIVQTKQACKESPNPHASCAKLLNDDKVPPCLRSNPAPTCIPTYWTRDYVPDTTKISNCWDPSGSGGAIDLSSTAPGAAASAVSAGSSSPSSDSGRGPASIGDPKPRLVCSGTTVYVQIYGPELSDYGALLRKTWAALGASVQPLEDVWDTARRAEKRPPQPYPAPMIFYQNDQSGGSKKCAESLVPEGADPSWQVRPAPEATSSGRAGVIQVWIPPLLSRAGQVPPFAFCYQEDDKKPSPTRYGVHCHATKAACVLARGDNKQRIQSSCTATALTGASGQLFSRGWAGSWYLQRATPFDVPFPELPESAASVADGK